MHHLEQPPLFSPRSEGVSNLFETVPVEHITVTLYTDLT
jgi:hypothetical protein